GKEDYATYCQKEKGAPAIPAGTRYVCFQTSGVPPLFGSDGLSNARFYSNPTKSSEFVIVLGAGSDSYAKIAVGESTVQVEGEGRPGCVTVAITQDASGVPRPEDGKQYCGAQGSVRI
ncbi:hypothetical protein, partial [Sporisorium scitamineum]